MFLSLLLHCENHKDSNQLPSEERGFLPVNDNNNNNNNTIIAVIIGATGIVTRSLRKNLEAVPGKHSIDSLQKTAILGTSHIIRKVLQCEA
jgi:hypothetical protein